MQLYGSSGKSPTSFSDLILLIVGIGAADTNNEAGGASLPHRPMRGPGAKSAWADDDGRASVAAELDVRNVCNWSIIIF